MKPKVDYCRLCGRYRQIDKWKLLSKNAVKLLKMVADVRNTKCGLSDCISYQASKNLGSGI
jgi:hypothetical protein